MKLSLLAILPLASMAFAPVRLNQRAALSSVVVRNEIDDVAEKIVSTTEDYVAKADSTILSRVMRVVDHAPAFVTLKALADKGGISAGLSGIACDAGAFSGLGTALAVPAWTYNIWGAIACIQGLSLAKSALASDGNELSQADITANTAANFMAARSIGSSSPLRDTVLTALVSGFAARNGSGGGDATIHSAGLQLMSSFTTVLSVLGIVSAVSAKIPIISGSANAVSLLGIASYYVMATRAGNGTTKKAINAGVAAGMLYSRLLGGVTMSLNAGSILTNVALVGTAYVAYLSVDSLRKAVFA